MIVIMKNADYNEDDDDDCTTTLEELAQGEGFHIIQVRMIMMIMMIMMNAENI